MDTNLEAECSSNIKLANGKVLIDSLDLSPVIARLTRIDKWLEKHTFEACKQYRNYLYLKLKYGHLYELPPSLDIDEVWHAHILHTEDYYEFSKKVFGGFLHHHPHHGKGNTITQAQLEQMFEDETQRLYHSEFGEYIYQIRPMTFGKKIAIFYNNIFKK